jgi:hypothetical protein
MQTHTHTYARPPPSPLHTHTHIHTHAHTITCTAHVQDLTVAWFIQNYAGLYPLSQLVNSFVSTPVVSML